MKKLQTIVSLITFFVISQSFAQLTTISNERVFGGSKEDYGGVTYMPIENGHKIIMGASESNISGDKSQNTFGPFGNFDLWILRLDENNNKVWDKSYGGDSDEYGSSSVILDNKIYFATSTYSGISGNKTTEKIAPPFKNDLWVVCLDFDGNILWQKSYSDTINGYSNLTLRLSPENTIFMGGRASGQFKLIEIATSDGEILRDTAFSSNRFGAFTGFNVNELGEVFFSSICSQGTDGIKTDPGFGDNQCLFVLNPDWSLKNQKCFGSSTGILPSGASIVEKDGFIYFAFSHGPGEEGIGNKTAPSYNNSYDLWLIKLDEDLNILWDKTYGGSADESGCDLFIRNNQIYLNVISVTSTQNPEGNKTNPGYLGYDLLFMLLDLDGNIVNQATIGGSGYDYGTIYLPIDEAATKATFVSSSNSPISGLKSLPSKGMYDIWLFDVELSELLHVNESHTLGKISVFPNPTSGELTFQLTENQNELTLNIYSPEGKLVYQDRIDNHATSKTISLDVPAGVLFYTLSSDIGQVSGKIIKL